MRKVMAEAPVGDDVFGDDPTINRLQDRVAELLGKEAALYVPSGTMANQIALSILTHSGDEVFCEAGAHIFNYESGAPAIISRIQIHPIEGNHGTYTREMVEARLRPKDHHFPPGAVIEIENTANRAGGCIWPIEEIARLRELADEQGMRIHLDGARLWNAAVGSGIKEHEWASYADTVSVCFSKGLGAPVGSAIAGTKELIDEAHRMRKRLGGGMRQAGIIAAGALYAIDNHRTRLADDHARAKKLGEAINELPGFSVDIDHLDTNIIILDAEESGITSADFADKLKSEGILITFAGKYKARMVTHLEITDEMVNDAIETLNRLFGK